jgi:hypothetical protein
MNWKNAVLGTLALFSGFSSASDKKDHFKIKMPDKVVLGKQLTDNCFADMVSKTNIVDLLASKELTPGEIVGAVKKALVKYWEGTDWDNQEAASRFIALTGKETINLLKIVLQEFPEWAEECASKISIIYNPTTCIILPTS